MNTKTAEKIVTSLLEKAKENRAKVEGWRSLFASDKPLAEYLTEAEREKLRNVTRKLIKK